MDLPTITMDRTKAREAFLEYRDAVRARHTAEDAQIMRGYRALAHGHQIINLRDTIALGGLNDQQLPALAIGRADRDWAWLTTSPNGAVTYHHDDPWETAHNAGPRAGTWKLPAGTLPEVRNAGRFDHYRAMMPISRPPCALRTPSPAGNAPHVHPGTRRCSSGSAAMPSHIEPRTNYRIGVGAGHFVGEVYVYGRWRWSCAHLHPDRETALTCAQQQAAVEVVNCGL